MSDIPYLFDSYIGGADNKIPEVLGDKSSNISEDVTRGLDVSEDPEDAHPTDRQLTDSIKEFIDRSDIHQIKFKSLKSHLNEVYGMDLSDRSTFIKSEVLRIIDPQRTEHGDEVEKPDGAVDRESRPGEQGKKVTRPATQVIGTCNQQDVIDKQSIPAFDIGDDLQERTRLPYWVLPNKRDFSKFINENFKIYQSRSSLKERPNVTLQNHQVYVSEFIQSNSPYRGMLLYHGLGSGKTAASLFIADGIPDKQMIIMLPASIEDNYKGEIRQFSSIKDTLITTQHWCFYPLDNISDPSEILLYRNQLFGKLETNLNASLLRMIVVDRAVRYSERSNKWQVTHRIGDAIKVVKSFNTKAEADKKYRKIIKGKSNIPSRFGIWLVKKDHLPNYDVLNSLDQAEITDTVNIIYKYKYKFIRYNAGQALLKSSKGNGVFDLLNDDDKLTVIERLNIASPPLEGTTRETWADVKINGKNWSTIVSLIGTEGGIRNPFSNKIIVVDEIHNFVSRIVGGGYTCKSLYSLIMSARNSKFVFLSGTPAINDPFELGILFNMLRGNTNTYKFKIQDNSETNRQKTAEIFNNSPSIDYYSIDDGGTIYYTLNPYGFINIYDSSRNRLGVVKANHITINGNINNVDKYSSSNTLVEKLIEVLEKLDNKLIVPTIPTMTHYLGDINITILQNALRDIISDIIKLFGIDYGSSISNDNIIISREPHLGNKLNVVLNFHNIPKYIIDDNYLEIKLIISSHFKLDGDDISLDPPFLTKMEPIYQNTCPRPSTFKSHVEQLLSNDSIKVLELENDTYIGPFPSFSGTQKINEKLDLARDEFKHLYINAENNTVRNEDDFKINIFGLVSHFHETTKTDEKGNSIFPEKLLPHYETGLDIVDNWDVTGIRLVEKEMSNYQFIRYSEARDIERETEFSKSKKGSQFSFGSDGQIDHTSINEKSSSYFKVMSRNCLLFVFPPNLERLWPSNIKAKLALQQAFIDEMFGNDGEDNDEDDDDEVNKLAKLQSRERAKDKMKDQENYLQMKARILDGLTPDNLTVNDREHYNLSVLSPKYVDIYNNIEKSPGLVMCYSQFRTVEGIEVFRRVLEAHGYNQYKPSDQMVPPIVVGKTMTRVCLFRKKTHADKDDAEEIWATAKPVQVKETASNIRYYGYRSTELYTNLQKSLSYNGRSEKVINKTVFRPTRNVEEIRVEINRIFIVLRTDYRKHFGDEQEKKPGDPSDGSIVASMGDDIIWISEFEGDDNQYN